MNAQIVTLDVREDLRNGREPFAKIMEAVAQLQPDEELLLVAPFEPAPLFSVLSRQGFDHVSKQTASGDWEVLFTRRNGELAAAISPQLLPEVKANNQSAEIVELDARGLEPPQPMITILEALEGLPGGAELRAHTDRRPMHLYAHLEERGFVGETREEHDGSHVTIIRRR